MSQPASQSLHLLRALLRECSYLPDESARLYLHRHVLYSFRVHCPRPPISPPTIVPERLTSLLHKARKGVSVLRRANEGYLGPLTKVLYLTYGRTGRRRRQLMLPLTTTPPTPQDHKAVEAAGQLLAESTSEYGPGWKPRPLVQAMINSQAKQLSKFENGVRPQGILGRKLDIPETNIWGRPMPLCRIKNTQRRWFADVLDSIFPPLPEAEWKRLEALATGTRPWSGPIPRRQKAQVDDAEDTEHISALTGRLLVHGPEKSESAQSWRTIGHPHRITPRLMRRLWTKVFALTPLVTWDTSRRKWTVQWGDAVLERPLVANCTEDKWRLLFRVLEAK